MTPYEQWRRLKREHDGHIVFVLLGDFYEAFEEDALVVRDVCGIQPLSRKFGDTRVIMAGVPRSSAYAYSETLIKAGYKVALAEMA